MVARMSKKRVIISMTLPPEMIERIDSLAKTFEKSRSQMLVELVGESLGLKEQIAAAYSNPLIMQAFAETFRQPGVLQEVLKLSRQQGVSDEQLELFRSGFAAAAAVTNKPTAGRNLAPGGHDERESQRKLRPKRKRRNAR